MEVKKIMTHLYQTMQHGDSKFSKLNQRFIRGKTNPSLGQVKCVPENNCLFFL